MSDEVWRRDEVPLHNRPPKRVCDVKECFRRERVTTMDIFSDKNKHQHNYTNLERRRKHAAYSNTDTYTLQYNGLPL